MTLENIYKRIATEEGQKLRGTFVGQEAFEAAGGSWDPDSIQWVGYWGDGDQQDPTCLYPWADFTLMAHSSEVGDSRPATPEDLRKLGYMTREEWLQEEGY